MNFQQIFEAAPEVEASAPGRVNLLGEHTDYNEGFVLPAAIPQQTTIALGYSADAHHHFYSAELNQLVEIATDAPAGFGRYLYGCIRVLEAAGQPVPPLCGLITSSIPLGAGLSSSAALEVALLRGLRSLLKLDLTPVQIAQLAQQAEIQYAGVQCGILDQMASSLADMNHLLFLDTRTLDRKLLPLPQGAEILAIDSGSPRTLATSGYNQRRAECEAAARQLGVTALRDATLDAVNALPDLLRRRALHVVTENNRVLEASQGVTALRLGALMNASHASLRDNYEVSIAALDNLVELLQQSPQVFGAKLTGAGFGGACVALVATDSAKIVAQQVLGRYRQQGYTGRLLVPQELSECQAEAG